ncbi:MAG: dioxygenase [Burkholderiales bacterium]|nr:dioxygenase [Burkholderiales bacterium]
MTSPRLPTFFISHGGGPWPWMTDRLAGRYDRLAAALRQMPHLVGAAPKAVLMISAHWEAPEFTAMAHPQPPMIYDYYGFPDYTYQIAYAAPGMPSLATRVHDLLEGAGIAARLDAQRGFDHGMYAPMAVIYPNADMPTVQLSLRHGLDPLEHLALGRALAPLRDEGVLIIGSGLSYHNLRVFGPAGKAPSGAFDAWLRQTLADTDAARRSAALAAWEAAPSARQAHPREEHLLPLMAALGAAEHEPATLVYHEDDFAGGLSVSSFMFGGSQQAATETA